MRRLLVMIVVGAAVALGLPGVAGAASPAYAALGDSYSSGLGTGSYTLNSTCKRGTKAYPYLFSGTATGFVACSGADVNSVRATQLSATGPETTTVTMTVGGNDVGFTDVVTTCTTGSDSACQAAVNTAKSKMPYLQANLVALLQLIRTNAPSARIVLLDYPYLYSTGTCNIFFAPSLTKRQALHDGADALDATLAAALGDGSVSGSKVFVDVRARFTGHDICASSTNRWINGLNLFNTSESFHPNTSGHAKGYLPALQTALVAART